MSETTTAGATGDALDPYDVRVALRARPLLARFNAAGVLTAADVHVAQRLGALGREDDERVLLAVALAVRGVRSGSVCLDLADAAALATAEVELEAEAAPADLPWPATGAWVDAVTRSPLVAVGVDGPADRPVRWVDGRLYLDRYWRYEQVVRTEVDARLTASPYDVDRDALRAAILRLFPGSADGPQRVAAASAALSPLTVLTGGPGTGKTTTVARILAVLHEVAGDGPGGPAPTAGDGAVPSGRLRVALAAPTGKAAARLREAVHDVVGRLPAEDRARIGTLEATTIHRLLGWRPGSSTRFRHDRHRRLPQDVVVVDETSMVSLPLMASLLEALRPQTRLLLVGDPDQLASVEAGAVLGDLVARAPVGDALPGLVDALLPEDAPRVDGATEQRGARAPDDADARTALRNGVVRLTTVHRFGTELAALAAAIRAGDADVTLDLLRAGGDAVELVETDGALRDEHVAAVRADIEAAGSALVTAARAGDATGALEALERHRLLLAHRRGPAGVAHWATQAEAWVEGVTEADRSAWPLGRPLLVTTNDRDTGLYNGDTGVVVSDGEGGVLVAFGDPATPRLLRPHRLPAVQPVHAMTVHRGQGSQFARVSLILPPATSPLLTRELLCTAVTRARDLVRVVGTEAAIRAAVGREVRRASGLRAPLSPRPSP